MVTRYRRSERLLTAEVDTDVLLFDPKAGMYFATRGVGAFLWEVLSQPRTVEELCVLVQDRYDVASDACCADVAEFIRDLQDAELIEVSSDGSC
jgi:hypothetical protein